MYRIRKTIYRTKRLISSVFGSPKLLSIEDFLNSEFSGFENDRNELAHMNNVEEYARLQLIFNQDAAQKNINIMYRTMIFAFIATLASIIALIVTLHSKPPVVIVKPSVIIRSNEQKAIQ